MSHHNVPNPPTFFINTSTASSTAAAKFFVALGFEPISQYTDAKTASLRLPAPNATICLMVHEHTRLREFMRPDTEVADANKVTEALFSLTASTKDEVDATLAKAVAAGATADPYTMPNYGADCGMYTRSFADLDGHLWEVCAILGSCGGEAASQS